MNILRYSKRSGLVKLKEHQMQDKITIFFLTSAKFNSMIKPRPLTRVLTIHGVDYHCLRQ
jgi:hypothetical protein